MQQEKSRALEITAERAARSSVLVISRTMPSRRLAITVITTGSSPLGRGLCAALPPAALEIRFALEVSLGLGAGFAGDLAFNGSLTCCLAMRASLMTSKCNGRKG